MPPGNYQIQGQLPFPQANVGGMFNGDLAGSYQSAYNSALGQNQANYSNILSGYQQTMANQTSAQGAIGQGYTDLYNTVMGGIQGIDQSQRQAIQDQYAQQSGGLAQQMASSGLGNTTVSGSMQRGVDLDKAKADIALSNQTAQLTAGYQSNLGLAGLNYQNQANMQNTALAGQQMNWMNSVNSLYPSADAYSKLFQQQGQIGQANQDRAQNATQFGQQLSSAQSARGAAGGGGGLPTIRSPMPTQDSMGMAGGSGGMGASVTPYGMTQMPQGGLGATAFGPYQAGVMGTPNTAGGLPGIAGGVMNGVAAYQNQQGMGTADIPSWSDE